VTTRAVLRLKRGHDRPRWHPWIFKADVADAGDVEAGDAVTVIDATGHLVGRGFYNPRPALCCRILTRRDEPIDAGFLARRVADAVARRRRDGRTQPEVGRLVWSEADGLPGLVADRYGPVVVIQCLTLGMARRRREIGAAIRAALGDVAVFSADEAHPAELEGFAPERGWLDTPGPSRVVVAEAGVKLAVAIGIGHKTGLYLDQRENRARVAALARGVDVLDVFSYTAGFACHALVAGARRATCIESSPDAIAGARENLALNGVADRAAIIAGNAFDELRRLEREPARFGLVVLDPPPFARGRGTVGAALRGYKEINLRAMRLLARGGRLATFSCSHHVTEAVFEEVCRDAARDIGIELRILDRLAQASDHPVILTIPETRYLKGLLLERV
jgi:23S rRNA (cytosine1962-C5)-methyltransferase